MDEPPTAHLATRTVSGDGPDKGVVYDGHVHARRRARTAIRLAGDRLSRLAGRRADGMRRDYYRGPLPVVMCDSRGFSFELESGIEVETFRRHGGHFETAAIQLTVGALRAGDTALDIGANIGAFSVAMAHAVGLKGRVFAFEPCDIARRRLARTIELNGIQNTEIVPVAVAAEVGNATLFDYGPGYESWSTLAPRVIDTADGAVRASGRAEVATTALDTFADNAPLERVAVAKIDVEGAEALVIAGAERMLARAAIDVLVIEASDHTFGAAGSSVLAVFETLVDHGLEVLKLGENGQLCAAAVTEWVDSLVQLVAVTPSGRERLISAGFDMPPR